MIELSTNRGLTGGDDFEIGGGGGRGGGDTLGTMMWF